MATVSTQTATTALSSTRPPKMTLRQRLLVSGVVDGKSIAQAGRDAGYKSRHNAHDSLRDVREKLPALLVKHGLDADSILDRLRDKLDATKTVTASAFGEITDSMEIADNPTQIKAIEIAVDLHGMTQRDDSVRIGTVNILWAGQSPAWAGQASGDTDAQANQAISVDASVHTYTQSVIDGESVPISTIEGTGGGPAPSTHTHSAKSATRGVLTQRIVKRRKPRLPVFRGDK